MWERQRDSRDIKRKKERERERDRERERYRERILGNMMFPGQEAHNLATMHEEPGWQCPDHGQCLHGPSHGTSKLQDFIKDDHANVGDGCLEFGYAVRTVVDHLNWDSGLALVYVVQDQDTVPAEVQDFFKDDHDDAENEGSSNWFCSQDLLLSTSTGTVSWPLSMFSMIKPLDQEGARILPWGWSWWCSGQNIGEDGWTSFWNLFIKNLALCFQKWQINRCYLISSYT